MTYYKFKKVPANFGQVKINKSESLIPNDIYEYAQAFRGVYTRSMPMLKKIADLKWATHQEIKQLYGKPQSLAVQIAMSNELLLKAILLSSTGELIKGHSLKLLLDKLNKFDSRYIDIIKNHLERNGLKKGKWNNVLKVSDDIFITARYGFESKDYILDFITLQLLNEALDDIFNNYLPDWTSLNKVQQKNKERLKKEVDLIFDEDYQKEQKKFGKDFMKGWND